MVAIVSVPVRKDALMAAVTVGSDPARRALRPEAETPDVLQIQEASAARRILDQLTPKQRWLCLLGWHLSGKLLAAAQLLEKIAWAIRIGGHASLPVRLLPDPNPFDLTVRLRPLPAPAQKPRRDLRVVRSSEADDS